MFAHGCAGELVVLGVPFVGLLLIDDVQDGDLRQVCQFTKPPLVVIAQLVGGDFRQRLGQEQFQIVQAPVDVGRIARARRIHNVLVARQNVLNVARQHAAGAEQVDLEDQRIELVFLIEQMLQRRIGNDAAVPEVIGADLDHRQRRRQSTARHDVLGLDRFLGVVEIDEVAGQDIHGTDRKSRALLVDEREIHQLQQGVAQRRAVIVTGRRRRAGEAHPRIGKARSKKARLAGDTGDEATVRVARLAENVAIGRERPDFALGDQIPELAQPTQTVLGCIAGDDRRINRADGHAGHPVRFDPGLVHCLINTGLVGAERAAALEDERNAVAALRAPAFARTGRKGGLVDRAGTDVMHGGYSKMRIGGLPRTFAKAGDRQMTSAPNAEMKRLSYQCRRTFTFSPLGGAAFSVASGDWHRKGD